MLRPIALANVIASTMLAGLLLAGCVSVGNSSVADEATVAQIKVGQTTKQQVEALLGEPSERWNAMATPEWWAYSYSSSTINPLEYLLLYGFWVNGLGLFDTRLDLQVFFNPQGTVRRLVRQTTSYDMGSPLSSVHLTSTVTYSVVFEGYPTEPRQFTDKIEVRY